MAQPQPAPDAELVFTTTHDYVFAQPGPLIQIFGRKVAIDELHKGIEGEGLAVRPDQPDHASTALEQSLDLLRAKNAFPDNEALLRFTAQSPELQLAGGITPEDWVIRETVLNCVYPPFHFQQLNVDFVLAFLRVAQKCHSEERVYQLVILTQTTQVQYRVDKLLTIFDAPATHSVYLYRHFVRGQDGAIVENWKGFMLRPGAREPTPEVAPPLRFRPDLLLRLKRLRAKQEEMRKRAASDS
ncbi:uncharacterized protein RCC_09293 [Ramularia collo-cygni]|uniref:Uncharacterized protein n=1 Tax=Ramularia collo-cygni TaxID=112498 RepID=A0A2D3VJS7_9PEZI|nr:uncharacterized protein RCC_09293 [Ramularia collo-cygni]CZT23579.1 uncharacterized protein RCC_09293 [Ramularia collo-cygni]